MQDQLDEALRLTDRLRAILAELGFDCLPLADRIAEALEDAGAVLAELEDDDDEE
jgi:hypothetical protein